MNSMTASSDQLTLFELCKYLLAELQTSNRILMNIQQQSASQGQQLAELTALLTGFSNGGASFSAYQVDPMTQAYLQVMGPLLASRLETQPMELPELMKGATLLARELIEELAAYRSERASLDYLEDQTELISDPWKPPSTTESEP